MDTNTIKTTNDQLALLDIKELHESSTNPRKYFSAGGLKELAESIKVSGLINRLLVRENKGPGLHRFEIVDGARRFRACHDAGLKQVPAIITRMTDEQVKVAQLLSFLQSEDIHPLDEALSYQQLLSSKLYDVPGIAAKVGKPESYIRQRLQLEKLSDAWKKHYWGEVITLAHALILARLTPLDQERAYKDSSVLSLFYRSNEKVMCNLPELKHWVENNCYKKLSQAAWSLTDAELLKEAGSCAACPKRTGFNKTLFNDVRGDDICTDGKCYNKKQQRILTKNLNALNESGEKFVKITLDSWGNNTTLGTYDYKKAKAKAKGAIKGIVTAGKSKGKILNIIPKAGAVKDAKKNAAKRSQEAQTRSEAQAKEAVKQKALARKLEEVNKARLDVFKAIAKKQGGFTRQDWGRVTDTIINEHWRGQLADTFKAAGIKTLSKSRGDGPVTKYLGTLPTAKLERYLALIIIADKVELDKFDLGRGEHKAKGDELYAKARDLKVDIEAAEKAQKGAREPAEAPPAGKQAGGKTRSGRKPQRGKRAAKK